MQNNYNQTNGGYRGGRGGGFHRGAMNSNTTSYNSNYRNFSNPSSGYNSGTTVYQNNSNSPMTYGGFNNRGGGGMSNRGGMGGMRGRGGLSMGGMPMGMNMGMGMGMGTNMGIGGGMNPMMNGMGMQGAGGFQGVGGGQFNTGFYNHGQAGGGDGSWNPHGAKRTRQE